MNENLNEVIENLDTIEVLEPDEILDSCDDKDSIDWKNVGKFFGGALIGGGIAYGAIKVIPKAKAKLKAWNLRREEKKAKREAKKLTYIKAVPNQNKFEEES